MLAVRFPRARQAGCLDKGTSGSRPVWAHRKGWTVCLDPRELRGRPRPFAPEWPIVDDNGNDSLKQSLVLFRAVIKESVKAGPAFSTILGPPSDAMQQNDRVQGSYLFVDPCLPSNRGAFCRFSHQISTSLAFLSSPQMALRQGIPSHRLSVPLLLWHNGVSRSLSEQRRRALEQLLK